MNLKEQLLAGISECLGNSYNWDGNAGDLELELTNKEYKGDFTFVVFPYLRYARTAPEKLATDIGTWLVDNIEIVETFNVVKGFLNIELSDLGWHQYLMAAREDKLQVKTDKPEKIIVEFCSPNTNKPLHLGHIRNILLGDSLARILESVGHEVIKTQIINDRGIAICKSMLAWIKWGKEKTPDSTRIKGDHFIGKFYVLFDKKFNAEYAQWQEGDKAREIYAEKHREDEELAAFFSRYKNSYFNEHSVLGGEARDLLLKWEDDDPEVMQVWRMMNEWGIEGFEETFESLNVEFDKNYYESETYLIGKDIVLKGERDGVFEKHADGSIWVDLKDKGLDEKILLRADGTSLYITQDIGTAQLRYEDYGMNRMIYVVGDEQEYHFQALFASLEKLGVSYAEGLYNLAYGMVDLPSGKMKSREGNVVDADDLIEEVRKAVLANAQERGELDELTPEEHESVIRNLALGALKFFIIQVNPRRRMLYDPQQSVDLHGHTGPYVQNAYVRIKSLLRKREESDLRKLKGEKIGLEEIEINAYERSLLLNLHETTERIMVAAEEYNPAYIADQAYQIAKSFHRFYHEVPILRSESPAVLQYRLSLCRVTAEHLKHLFKLINVDMPERM